MNTQQNQMPHDVEKLKEIPKWTRRYAENRVLTIVVLTVLIMLISIVFPFPLVFAMAAFTKGNRILGLGIAAFTIVLWIALFIPVFKKFGGKNRGLLDRLVDQKIYGREGTVSLGKSELGRKITVSEIVTAIIWFSLFFGTLHLGNAHIVEAKYLQPIAAVFWVPYMIGGWYLWQSPKMGPIYLLLPILYAVHAILILAGVPLYITGFWGPFLNMGLPYMAYLFVTYLVSYIYGRYAMKKLKSIARAGGGSANGI
jgi:hypothetical protein